MKSHFSHVLFIDGGSTFILLIAYSVYGTLQSLPPLAAFDESKNHVLTYNLKLSTGVDRPMFIVRYTLIHP